jgi:ABC-type multidrug transport system ATPase subunit
MLTGDLVPTAGNAWVGGHSIITDLNPVMSDTGFCPQFGGLFEYNTVQEELALYCELRGMTLTQQDSVVALILDALDLKEHTFKLTSQLSGGNKRKLSAALTLLGSPRTIYLDEPSTGVDAKARRKLWDLIDANKVGDASGREAQQKRL